MTSLAQEFNRGDAHADVGLVHLRPPEGRVVGRCRGRARRHVGHRGYGPRPVIWSPASSAWGGVLDQRLQEQGKPAMAPTGRQAVHGHAARDRDAEADGRGARLARHADRVRRHREARPGPERLGQPRPSRVGPVPAGEDEPELLDERALRADRADLRGDWARRAACPARTWPTRPSCSSAARSNPPVVHYGDTTLTFLNNWYRADRRGTALTYTSAIAVEEKSIIDYNSGNPDGVLAAGRAAPQAPHPARGDLPEGRDALLGQPLLRARRVVGVDEPSGRRAAAFQAFVLRPANQQKVLKYGFRPGQPGGRGRRRRSSPSNGVDPTKPETLLEVPDADGPVDPARHVEPAAQGCAGAVDPRRVRLDGRPGIGYRRRDQARPRQAGRGRRARPVQGRRPGRAARLLDATRAVSRTRRSSTWCPSHRSAPTASRCATRSSSSSPSRARRSIR